MEQYIKAMKKDLFKKYVKEKLESKANEFLMNLKENHSKTKNLTSGAKLCQAQCCLVHLG